MRRLRREYELLARARQGGGADPRTVQQEARAQQALSRAQREAARAAEAQARAQRRLDDAVRGSSSSFSEFLDNLASGVAYGIADRGLQLVIDALQSLISATIEFGRESIDVATESRQLNRALEAILGSAEAAGESFETLTEIANRNGVDVGILANRFTSLAGATRGTSIELDEINQFLERSSRAFQIFGVDTEAADRVLLGLQQSLGRGAIQAEELGQVIENFPAARGIIADGLGVDMQELTVLLQDGTFSAQTFFRAFSEGLAQVEGSIDPSQAAIAQLNAQVRDVQRNLGDALLTLQTAGAGLLSGVVDTAITDQFFDGLAQATQRFSDTLAENPEIAEELGFALREVSLIITELLIDGIQEFTDTLRDNPEVVEELADGIGRLARLIDNITRGVAGVFGRLDQLGRVIANSPIVRIGDTIGRALAGGERSARGIEGSIGSLVDLQAEFASLTQESSQSLAEEFRNAEAIADQLERARDAERERSRTEFQEGQATDRLTDRRAVQAEQRAFDQEQSQLERNLEAELQQSEAAFNEREQARALANEEAIQQFREQGAEQIELIQSRSADRINRLNEDAARRIQEAQSRGFDNETGRTQIDQLELEAERSLQLEDVKDRRERRRLEEQFEAEDEAAARRFEAFAPVREAERALAEEIAQIERERDEEVQQVRLQTEENVAAFRQALQETEQEFRIQQEEALATRREALEQQLQLRRDELQAQLEQRLLAFQTQQEDAALAAQFERQRIQREFQAEQRRLDEESAERVREVREGVGAGGGSVPTFREGGVAPGGAALVGEAGPELVSLPRGARIHSNTESVKIAQSAIATNPALATPFLGRSMNLNRNLPAPPVMNLSQNLSSPTDMRRVEALLGQLVGLNQPPRSRPESGAELLRQRRRR